MIKASAKVNTRVFQRVRVRIKEKAAHARSHTVSVGIHEAEGQHPKLDYEGNNTDATVVEVAAAHELGHGVRGRSWLRSWFDRNRSRIIHATNAAMLAEYKGDHGAIEKLGDDFAIELRDWIEMEDASMAKLEPQTVERKRRAGLDRPETPLFATGELVSSIRAYMDGEKR